MSRNLSLAFYFDMFRQMIIKDKRAKPPRYNPYSQDKRPWQDIFYPAWQTSEGEGKSAGRSRSF